MVEAAEADEATRHADTVLRWYERASEVPELATLWPAIPALLG